MQKYMQINQASQNGKNPTFSLSHFIKHEPFIPEE